MKTQKRYWLRGLGVGLIIYVIMIVVLFSLSGVITCNGFITEGPIVKESFLCKPAIFLVVMPVLIISELYEDILHGTLTHTDLYLWLLAVVAIYFGIFAFLGTMYGKRKHNNLQIQSLT